MNYFELKKNLELWLSQDPRMINVEDFTILTQNANHSTVLVYSTLVVIIRDRVLATTTLENALLLVELLNTVEKLFPRQRMLSIEDRVVIYNIHSCIFEKFNYRNEKFISELHESITILCSLIHIDEQDPDFRRITIFERLAMRAIGTIMNSGIDRPGLLKYDLPTSIRCYISRLFGKPLLVGPSE